jgi:type IV pilus biogenesis protein CpaD/CtpE
MMSRQVPVLRVLLAVTIVAGCASHPTMATDSKPSSQQEAARAMLDYRKLASELREMAHRRTLEAEILANQANRNEATVSHWRDMAQQLAKEAEEAEQHAREMQRMVPHGMVQ